MGCPCSRQTVQQTIRGFISKPLARRPHVSVVCSPIGSRRAATKGGPGDIAIVHAKSREGLTKLAGSGRVETRRNMECSVNHGLPYSPS